MNQEDVRRLICDQFLHGELNFPLAPDTNLLEEGICDSMGLVQLAASLEKRVPGLRIRDQEITRENLGSIERIARFVGSRVGL